MISLEEYKKIISELMDELSEAFFKISVGESLRQKPL